MDTMLYDGDHYVDARGVPVVVEDHRELVQRALIRLQVPKGSFPLDPQLGSELYKLRRSDSEANCRIALSYVQEALLPIPQVAVTGVVCRLAGQEDLTVEVGIRIEERHYHLEVNTTR